MFHLVTESTARAAQARTFAATAQRTAGRPTNTWRGTLAPRLPRLRKDRSRRGEPRRVISHRWATDWWKGCAVFHPTCCHLKPGVVFARHSVVIAVHLGVRTVPQEVLGLGSRTHLAAVLPAVTRETLRGLCNRDCGCPNGLIFRLRLCRRYGDVLLVIAPPAKGKQRVNYQLLQRITIFQYFPFLKIQEFLCSDFPPAESELVDKAAPLSTLLARSLSGSHVFR